MLLCACAHGVKSEISLDTGIRSLRVCAFREHQSTAAGAMSCANAAAAAQPTEVA